MSYLGLDVGTSRVKAVRFDASWRAADGHAEDTRVRRAPGGRCEQDMSEVWAAAARVVATVADRSPDPVDLLAVTAQGDGCWLLDAHGEPAGPALLWNDNRATDVVRRWQRDGTLDRAFAVNGCLGAPGVAAAQLRWLLDHEPDTVERAALLSSCGGWIHRNLTGRAVLEQTDAANPFFDAALGRYDDRLLDLFGIAALRRLLPPTVRGPERVAPLTARAAAEVGLPAGTPVALAPYDVAATAVGAGALDPGEAFAILGTTLCTGTVTDDPRLSRAPGGTTLPAELPGRWLLAYPTMSGTEVLDWAAGVMGLPGAGAVLDLAATSSATDPPLVLPYLSPAGERSPFLDPDARGAFLGLRLGHSRADLAMGVLTGLTLAVRDCLERTGPVASLAVSGGGTRSAAWCQAISDAVGVPVVRPDTVEVGARGAVLTAATDLGHFADLHDAVRAAVHPGQVYRPDAERGAVLAGAYAAYVAARDVATGASTTT